MTIEFSLTDRQRQMQEMIRRFAVDVVRPRSLQWDRQHFVDEDFMATFVQMANSMGGGAGGFGIQGMSAGTKLEDEPAEKRKKTGQMVSTVLSAEELALGDGALLISLPGPGLGGPPVRASGTPEQKERFLSIFKDMSQGLKWGAYGLTEPGAGSDVAGIRTTCRKDGKHWVLDGRKCYITNGGRASWNVIFATIDPTLGRAGHRASIGTARDAAGRSS